MVAFYEKKDKDILYANGDNLDFAAHLHNHIELVYMLEGEAMTYVDGNKALLKKGDVFISFPNQVHQFTSYGPESYMIFIISPDLLKELKKVLTRSAPECQVIQNVEENPVILSLFNALAKVYSEKEHTYRDVRIKGYLLALFSELLTYMNLQPVKSANSSMLQSILRYCTEHYTEEISLDMVAEALHASKYYISHLLKKKINMGFSDYVNALRISEACKYLSSEDKSITEIAYAVGFNTIRTFNRAFIKHKGVSPSGYRKKCMDIEEKK